MKKTQGITKNATFNKKYKYTLESVEIIIYNNDEETHNKYKIK